MSFIQTIPPNYKVPLVGIEVDPSQAGTPVQNLEALLVGYKIAAGTAVADVPIAVGNVQAAKTFFGDGSPLARAFEKYFTVDQGTPIVCLPITPPAAGVAATGTLTLAASSVVAGTLALYVAGQKVSVSIATADTAAQVATKVAAAITAATSLPLTATASTNTVALTAKWKGLTGNEIRIEDSILGVNGGEVLPAGLTITYPANNVLSGGTGVPDWTAGIANLGDEPYEWVSMPFTDTGSLSAWDLEYGFTDSGRWGWMRQTYGSVFSARKDTYSGHAAWGATYNSPVISVLEDELTSPSPTWETAAIYTARAAKSLGADPALPLHTLELTGHIPAPRQDRFNHSELNALAQVGLAIKGALAGNVSTILREQTQYQKNVFGRPDNAYELVTTLATLATIFRRLRQGVEQKFGRCKLANDGTRFGPGQVIATPKNIKAELVALYRQMEYDGLVENGDAFIKALIVQRSTTEPTTVEVLFPPDIINSLRRFNVRAQFRLQFATAV
ncbi:phage tail sheath C-terminal domain-containing protein [Methylobacterium durans]|uniref:Phage tail protein n=1 Tax=Methylobacterium durans TaxID=2202825 RepID=A0A2U8WCZ1_9HYPH|nr:phage tail sheath C-terminal domain-containing protein [Methylobacterium durans]AWN43166.1 phage tail protein [Methylobacterium durans]